MSRRAVRSALVVGLGMTLAACGGGSPQEGAGETAGSHAPITVYAAASLTGVFDRIGARVEQETGAQVRFTYAGSSDLAAQLGAGAPGDVFASANEKQMAVAEGDGVVAVGEARPFATNTLTVITPPDNPGHVARLADLVRVSTVVCAPQVPCGEATQTLFAAASLHVTPVSEENQVTDVLGKITSGQADAGLVYVTDATRAGSSVAVVPTPEAADISTVYPIAVTSHGTEDPARTATAEAFVAAVLDEQGRELLTQAGFGAP